MTCNQCCYSSMGRFGGAVNLHCGLVGTVMTEMPSECSMGKRFDSAAEREFFWLDSDANEDSHRLFLCRSR